MPKGVRLPPEVVQRVRDLYPLHGADWPGWETELPGFSREAIQKIAWRHGVCGPRYWTDEQDRIVAMKLAEACRLTGRRPLAVAHRMEYLYRKAQGDGTKAKRRPRGVRG